MIDHGFESRSGLEFHNRLSCVYNCDNQEVYNKLQNKLMIYCVNTIVTFRNVPLQAIVSGQTLAVCLTSDAG